MSNLFIDDGPEALIGEQKVFIATTAYDNPDASYTFSIQRSRQALADKFVKSAYCLLQGNCHVDDARNAVVKEFLLSDCSELVFIDADVSWRPECIVKLCSYDRDIVGGVYPFRREGATKKRGMPVRMLEGVLDEDENGLLEVEGLPTGFMKIRRNVLELLAKDADSFWNHDDKRMKVPILFERCYEKDTGARWGGDLNFCRKARARGFKVYAIPEMELGHTAKTIVKDTLGAALRRQAGTTLNHVVEKVRNGEETLPLISEAVRFMDNTYGALEDSLLPAIVAARNAKGPIIETGSGLSTILMAAANPYQTVFCLEHDEYYANRIRALANLVGLKNIGLCFAPLVDGWYNMKEFGDLPESFDLCFHDGPPRTVGDRKKFFDDLAPRCKTIIMDDADNSGYSDIAKNWATDSGYKTEKIEPRTMIIIKNEVSAAA